ncbi:MAG: hypothetical protein ACI4U3_04070, partial [Traorella sp.]
LPQHEDYNIQGYRFIKHVKHLYSHKTWLLDVYEYVDGQIPNDEYILWKNIQELNEIPIIGAHTKIIQQLLNNK